MENRIGNRTIQYGDCVLAFAIPTSATSFYECKLNPENRDLVPNRCGAWQAYEYQVVRFFNMVEPSIRSWGGEFVQQLTFNKFLNLFSRFPVIILFAHWVKNSSDDVFVEFYDGLFNISELTEQIPCSFSGILDLCVCHPEELGILIRDNKPRCMVRLSDREAVPRYWLYFYLNLFNVLREGKHTYFQAYEIAYRSMLERERE